MEVPMEEFLCNSDLFFQNFNIDGKRASYHCNYILPKTVLLYAFLYFTPKEC